MKKKLYLTSIIAAVSLSAFAQTSTITYSYANDDVVAYGLSARQRYDVAMKINNPTLAGTKVKKINAYLTAVEGMGECSVWLTSELSLSSGNNVANIGSYEVTPVTSQYAGYEVGLLTFTLDEPYEYDGGELYVGYSVNIEEASTSYQKSPILLSNVANSDGFFLHGTRTPLKWTDYSERAGGIAVISVELEGNFPESSLSFSSISDISAAVDKPFSVTTKVVNAGSQPASTIGYSYTVNGQTFNKTLELETPVINNPASEASVSFICDPINELGNYDFSITIESVNGVANMSEHATATCSLGVLPFQIKTRPLVEEFTGLWCGYCPRGFTGMELIGEMYGDDVVIICYHNDDGMAVTNTYPVSVSGFPSASINRNGVIDPYYGSGNKDFGINDNVKQAMETVATGDINIGEVVYNDDNTLTVSTQATFSKDIPNANYRIGYVLTANGLSDPSWGQANYFKGQTSLIGTALEFWVNQGSYVYGLVYNDVALNVEGMKGVNNTLPKEIKFGEVYENEFTIKCQEIKNLKKQDIPFELDNAVLNFFIINNSTNRIINANKLHLGESGVKTIDRDSSDATVVGTEYYDINGRRINQPANGLFIKVDKLSDGNIKTSKVIVK